MNDKQAKFEFKSEARQLLQLMIHSVYSNKEVFLRELISNASDALDRRRVESLTDKQLLDDGQTLEIQVEPNTESRTLTISDNGIGMSRQEAIDHLGTIARSGTKEFMKKLGESKRDEVASLIGQFGVGFYSSFMVAKHVAVITRRAGEETATRWWSTGDGTFAVEDAVRDQPGTTIVLELEPADADNALPDFTDAWVLRQTIKKHSDFVQYPIRLRTKKDEKGEASVEWQTVNSMKAIWTRPAAEVSEDEYNEFYRHISHDWQPALDRVAVKAEGTFEYNALLFIPETAPADLYWREGRFGLQLYANRILIMERCEDLVPSYLRFLKGVVDSPDLSLNVSREMLQQDRRMTQIRRRIIKKVLDALAEMQTSAPEKYAKFWASFGRVVKEGVLQDSDNLEQIQPLLMFPSSHDREKVTTLKGYIERMKPGQDVIYYISGESRGAVEKSPHLEALFARGYEVLYLVEPVDELLAERLTEFDGKKLQSVSKGTVELGSEEERDKAEKERKEAEVRDKTLLETVQNALKEQVKEVRLSSRLTTSPACLVGAESDLSPQLERLLEQAGQAAPRQKRILEINPSHPLLGKMRALHIADAKEKLNTYASLIYGQALLAEGSPLPDPAAFNRMVTDVMIEAG